MKTHMVFRFLGGTFFSIYFLLLFALSARGELVDEVVAIVNDEVITRSELLRVVQANSPDADSSRYREVLERLVDQKLIDQATKGTEIKVSEKEVDEVINNFKETNKITDDQLRDAIRTQGLTWEQYRKEIREGIHRNQMIAQMIRSQVTISEKEVKDYYEKHPDQFFEPAQIKIEKIFFPFSDKATPTEKSALSQQAEKVWQRIKAGDDFQKAAQELNLPEDKAACDVGFFKKGELLNTLDQEAFTLKPGEISNVIPVNKGYCIIRLLERSEEKTKKIDEVRGEIGNYIMQQKMETKFQEWLKELRSNAYIDIKL